MCFEASLPGLKKKQKNNGGVGGGGGGTAPPPTAPIFKHNARIMSLEGIHTL